VIERWIGLHRRTICFSLLGGSVEHDHLKVYRRIVQLSILCEQYLAKLLTMNVSCFPFLWAYCFAVYTQRWGM
jgi:hypothetical protein